jgi:hypothetical protein
MGPSRRGTRERFRGPPVAPRKAYKNLNRRKRRQQRGTKADFLRYLSCLMFKPPFVLEFDIWQVEMHSHSDGRRRSRSGLSSMSRGLRTRQPTLCRTASRSRASTSSTARRSRAVWPNPARIAQPNLRQNLGLCIRCGSSSESLLVHTNVADEDFAGVSEGCTKFYWTPWRTYLMGARG